MGCNCTRNKLIKIETIEPGLLNTKSKSKSIDTPMTINSLKVEMPYSHCNILVWTETDQEFQSLFPKTFSKYSPNPLIEVTLNFFSFLSFESSSLVVIDCMIFVVHSLKDAEKVKLLSQKYENICVQIVISNTRMPEISSMVTIPDVSKLFEQIYIQQCNLQKLLREIFTEMDENFDTYITRPELYKALLRLDPATTNASADEIMDLIDKDKDGRVTFNEFSYWWKRGRQGKKSLLDLTHVWASKINDLLPRMNMFSDKHHIDQTKSCKKIEVILGEPSQSKLNIRIKIGKSGKREEILRDIESKLTFNIRECWIAFALKGKSDAVVHQNLRTFEEIVEGVKSSLIAGSVSGSNLIEAVQNRVVTAGDKLNFAFSFDLNNDYMHEVLPSLDSLEKQLVSPVDDHIFATLTSNRSLAEHLESPGSNFFDSIGSGVINLEAEHWSRYGTLLEPRNKYEELLKEFALFEGVKRLQDPEFADLRPVIEYITMAFHGINILTKEVPFVDEILRIINSQFESELSIFARYYNIGMEFFIQGEDLVKMIKSS